MEESLIISSKETGRALARLTHLVHHREAEIGIPLLQDLQDQQRALRKDVAGHLIITMEVVEVSSEKDILDPDRAPLLAAEAVGDNCFLHTSSSSPRSTTRCPKRRSRSPEYRNGDH